MELLLRLPGDGNARSPFEEALHRVAAGGSLALAAPYLGVPVLQGAIARSTGFRLVTDAEEWLRAFARPARAAILDFIRDNASHVRHFRDLHAKVAISPALAMFGSANFTDRGLFQRQEVGALVTRPDEVQALRDWYDALWSCAVPIDLDVLARFEASLPPLATSEHAPDARLLPAPRVARPVATDDDVSDDSALEGDTEEALVAYLATAPSRPWVEQYLEAMRVLLEGLGVGIDGDPRVVATVRKGRFGIPLSINGRWVLQPWEMDERTARTLGVGILQRAELAEATGHVGTDVVDSYQYDPRPSDHGAPPPWMLAFADFAWLNDSRYLTEWLVASQVELYKGARASNAASHSRVLQRAAMDPVYRDKLLARVRWPPA